MGSSDLLPVLAVEQAAARQRLAACSWIEQHQQLLVDFPEVQSG